MRKNFRVFVFFLLSLFGMNDLIAQVATVLDAPFIHERIHTQNSFYSIFDLFQFESYADTEELKRLEKGICLYPTSPIFSEDHLWCKSIWREIPLNQENAHFLSDSTNLYYNSQNIGDIILNSILIDKTVTPYTSEDFFYPMEQNEVEKKFTGMKFNFLKIKEDWWYDKNRGTVQSAVIGVGLCGTVNGESCEIWIYYPEYKYGGSFYPIIYSDFLNSKFQTIDVKECIESHYYSSVIKKEGLIYGQRMFFSTLDDEVGFEFPELNAVTEIQVLLDDVNWYNRNGPGTAKELVLKCIDGTVIKGSLHNRMLQGKWRREDSEGRLIFSVEFVNSIPHGHYQFNSSSKKSREEGQFNFGLREGEWKTWDAKDHNLSIRNYVKGALDGKQVFYYETGQKACEFYFENTLPNGSFKRWYRDSALLESGDFLNGYVSGNWEIHVRIAEEWKSFLTKVAANEPDYFESDALLDGVLTWRLHSDVVIPENVLPRGAGFVEVYWTKNGERGTYSKFE